MIIQNTKLFQTNDLIMSLIKACAIFTITFYAVAALDEETT